MCLFMVDSCHFRIGPAELTFWRLWRIIQDDLNQPPGLWGHETLGTPIKL